MKFLQTLFILFAFQRCVLFAGGIVQGLGRKIGVEAGQRLAQPPFQNHIALVGVGALGPRHPDSQIGAVQHRVAQRCEPGEGGVFDDGFGEGGHPSFSDLCSETTRLASCS